MMSNAADGYLGDWLPHKDSCRCSDCQLEKAQKSIARLEQENHNFHTWGIVEIAVRNRNVAEYCEHWEERAIKAEQERDELKAQVARLSALVSERRKLWFEHWRPIIKAIGELSVQEGMDAIERDLKWVASAVRRPCSLRLSTARGFSCAR